MEIDLVNLVGSLGFPIVACGYFATSMNKNIMNNNNLLQQIIVTLQSNTSVIEKLYDKLDKVE